MFSKTLCRSIKSSGPDKDYGDLCDELECDFLDISQECLNTKIDDILLNLKLSDGERIALERSTIGQSKCDIWFKERKYRLTASNFGRVCKLREKTPRINTIKYILYNEELMIRTPAMM